jgi:hypothetical protein
VHFLQLEAVVKGTVLLAVFRSPRDQHDTFTNEICRILLGASPGKPTAATTDEPEVSSTTLEGALAVATTDGGAGRPKKHSRLFCFFGLSKLEADIFSFEFIARSIWLLWQI